MLLYRRLLWVGSMIKCLRCNPGGDIGGLACLVIGPNIQIVIRPMALKGRSRLSPLAKSIHLGLNMLGQAGRFSSRARKLGLVLAHRPKRMVCVLGLG